MNNLKITSTAKIDAIQCPNGCTYNEPGGAREGEVATLNLLETHVDNSGGLLVYACLHCECVVFVWVNW